MTQQLAIIGLVVLGAMVLVWFVMVSRLFDILRNRHANVYLAMGSPTLIMNSSLQNNLAFLRFLLRREDRKLNDPGLSSLCQFMVAFFWTYGAIFVAVIVLSFLVDPSVE